MRGMLEVSRELVVVGLICCELYVPVCSVPRSWRVAIQMAQKDIKS